MLKQAALASWKYDGKKMTDALLIPKWFYYLKELSAKLLQNAVMVCL